MPSLLAVLLICFIAAPVQDEPKPVLSNDPLTAEQIAVYRAMLADYAKSEDAVLNIANVTYPFKTPSEFKGGCPKEDVKEDSEPVVSSQPPAIHRLDPAVALNPKMVLVDPERQSAVIQKNDPQNLIMGSLKDHQSVSEGDLDKSVQTAFSTGLFALSEIVFNKQHTRAILAYSFSCGRLCGHGNLVILKKARGKWKVGKVCAGWVS